jgi:hypothetical protein
MVSDPGVTLVVVMRSPQLLDSEAGGEAIEADALVAPLRPGKVVAIGLTTAITFARPACSCRSGRWCSPSPPPA